MIFRDVDRLANIPDGKWHWSDYTFCQNLSKNITVIFAFLAVFQIYGGDKPRVREGGSFNAKKKFFENEIQEQEKQTITQGKLGSWAKLPKIRLSIRVIIRNTSTGNCMITVKYMSWIIRKQYGPKGCAHKFLGKNFLL